jgi:hypothetical protein
MKDHDGTGNEIFSDQPPHVPNRRVRGVMRIRTTEHGFVSMRLSNPELLGRAILHHWDTGIPILMSLLTVAF